MRPSLGGEDRRDGMLARAASPPSPYTVSRREGHELAGVQQARGCGHVVGGIGEGEGGHGQGPAICPVSKMTQV